MNLRPLLAIATLGVTALTGASVATAGAHAPSAEPDRILERNVSGGAAVRALGDDLDVVAERYDKTPAALASLLRSDSSLWVDPTGMLHVKEPLPTQPVESTATPEPGPFPNASTFNLHSRVGAAKTIFLDFDGGPVSGTAWNDFYTIPTTSQPAFDLDGNPATWSQAEHDTIQSVYQRVAEDFRPFDVDVTTQDPGAAALGRTSAGDTQFGTRVLITPSTDAATRICSNNCGGVAFVDVFDVVRIQLLPAGVGVPAAPVQRGQVHRRGRQPRGGPQPRALPRRHLERGLLHRPPQLGPDHGRRLLRAPRPVEQR